MVDIFDTRSPSWRYHIQPPVARAYECTCPEGERGLLGSERWETIEI